MNGRTIQATIEDALSQFPAVAILGPRQVGKTTLASQIAATRPSIYLDLETEADRSKLVEPALYLSSHADKLVILDEVQRVPALFEPLRGIIDAGRRAGRRAGRFLLLGSASVQLLRQSGESLAGRIAYVELAPFDVGEVEERALDRLWLRGGYPESFLASSDRRSALWRSSFIRAYLERDLPALGLRIPAETLRRLWTMLAHNQGCLLNAADLGRSLAVDAKTVLRYLDILVDLMQVRRLTPFHANFGKRLVRSPKIYLRDSGLLHSLLGIVDGDALLGHPVAGRSWEGMVVETLCHSAPPATQPSFFRTSAGAEIDLLLDIPGAGLWAIEIKRSLAPKVERGFHQARADLNPAKSFVVYPGTESYPIADGVEAIGLRELAQRLSIGRS